MRLAFPDEAVKITFVLHPKSMAQAGRLLSLSNDELVRWAHSYTLPAGDVFRARPIPAMGDAVRQREVVTR